MTLQELRNEFPLGGLSCTSCGGTLFVYITTSRNLMATIHTELQKNGSLKVVGMAIVIDQEGSQPLVVIAEREKIPQELLTKAILKQIADLPC